MGEANFGGTDDDAAVGNGCERGPARRTQARSSSLS